MSKLVAIVGRPNVGKSTLFNRLTGTRQAIVSDEAGTTRDRQYGKCEWGNKEFSLVDTGGWVVNSDDIFEGEIRKQVVLATEEADLILFLVDVKNGITDLDSEVASILRRTKVPVVLCANKADNNIDIYSAPEFYKLGLGDPYCVSAATGSGTGDLLDIIIEKLGSDAMEEGEEDNIPRFSVVGRPNAGKSSIINAFLGEDRNIVTDIAGTTRDSILTRYTKFGFDFYIVDTAGIRRKNKVTEDLEFYSVMRAIRSIENSDVCILMIDATRGIESQDLNIVQIIQRNMKSLVVVVNKWDLVEKDNTTMKKFTEKIREKLSYMPYAELIFLSAKTGQRLPKLFEMIDAVIENCALRVQTGVLNEILTEAMAMKQPPSDKGKRLRIYYITQVSVKPPTFVMFINEKKLTHFSYTRYIENQIRTTFGFRGTPIHFIYRERKEK